MTTTGVTNRELPAGTARLTIDVPRHLHRRLRLKAAVEDTTMTSIVVALLASMLDAVEAERDDARR